jgi:prophage antirepressor-like protein
MDILKAFSLLDTEYPINIQGTLEDPLFQANQIGKLLGISNIKDNIKDFTDDEKGADTILTLGGNQKLLFLTEAGLYKLLGRSRKPIAQKFQKWMVSVLKEIRIHGMYKLQQDKEEDKILHQYQCELATHKTLLKAYDKKNVVYICKFRNSKYENKFIIKIGSTQDIKERIPNISKSFNCQEPLLLDVFESNNYKKFERGLHHNEYISLHYEKVTKTDGTLSRETYLVNEEVYQHFITVINEIKSAFIPQDPKEIEEIKVLQYEQQIKLAELKLQQTQLELELKKTELQMISSCIKQDDQNQEDEEEDDDEEEENEDEKKNPIIYIKKRNNGSFIPKVYQYKPDDLKNAVRIYDSPAEVERTIQGSSTSSLKRAALNCTIYKDFRWLYVNRNESPPDEISETVLTKHNPPDIRYIAMIDIKKTKILAVYASQKEAVEARNLKCNSFTRAIKNQSISSGHYWSFFDECTHKMKTEYLEQNSLPDKILHQGGVQIQKIDPITNKMISTYNTKKDIVKKYQISYNKLNSLIKNDSKEVYKGFVWRLYE